MTDVVHPEDLPNTIARVQRVPPPGNRTISSSGYFVMTVLIVGFTTVQRR
jgi:hypothetical protein